MRPLTKSVRVTAVAAALALGLAACGGSETATSDNNTTTPAPTSEAQSGNLPASVSTGDPFADARTAASHMPMTALALATGISKAADVKGDVESDAANLRAGLTEVLQEHVYLAGIAVATAYHAGPDSDEFKAAAATLDENSKAVAAAVGSVAGPDNEKTFLQAWRSHVNDFVSYAVAAKGGDEAGKKEALNNLAAYEKTSGEFFEKITDGALPAEAVQGALGEHVKTLSGAIDAFASGDAKAFDKLKAAADHMPMTAKALAGGIDKAANIDGNPNSPASELRSGLTSLLQGHVYLASVAVFTAYTAGADSAEFEAAAGALDKNSVELSKAVGSVAGPDNEKTFLQVWRSHIDDFVSYAVAAAGDDEAGKQEALSNLDDYRTTAGGFFEEITGGAVPADAVAKELKTHIETLAGAIDSLKAALVK